MRKKRFVFWAICIVIALIFGYIDEEHFSEKISVNVYAPDDMEKAFSAALKEAGLNSTHRIKMISEKEDADIIVDYSKEDDEEYSKFAFSPFVIAYNSDDDNLDEMEESGLILISEYYEDDYYDIDFKMVIDEVIEEGKWSNLGVDDEDLNNIKIFYPAESTIYWDNFYDFMLVTVNNGEYPKDSQELENAEEYIERFLRSDFTEPVTDFEEQVVRTNGFPESAFYVLPEHTGFYVSSETSEYARFFYPTETVNFNYYLKTNSDVGKQIVNSIDDSDSIFYDKLSQKSYRSQSVATIDPSIFNRIYDDRDAYKVVEVVRIDDDTRSEINSNTETDTESDTE